MNAASLPLQQASLETWEEKYRLHDKDKNPVDADVDAMFDRVARTLAHVEKPRSRAAWFKKFRQAMEDGAIPAGRILSNAGAGAHKNSVSLINCVVSETVEDSMEGIFHALSESSLSLKAGCGIGYDFSTLRPNGAFIHGAGATTNGPLAFMDIFDKTCRIVRSAGGRRGAQMGTLDVRHPDVLDFISAKREKGRLEAFNLSLLIDDEFINAVRLGSNWDLYWKNNSGLVSAATSKTVNARSMWDTIMQSTYDFADPGFLLIDRINKYNNLWFMENIRATNPCGEQPLPPHGSCLLGSINLVKFVINPFMDNAKFDWDKFDQVVAVFTRMLDNVVEISGLPLDEQRWELETKRRHGMGFLGLGSAMAMLRIPYGSPESLHFTEMISRRLALTGFRVGTELAVEKGEAPALQSMYTAYDIKEHTHLNTNFAPYASKVKKPSYSGRELFLRSHYFDAWQDDAEGCAVLRKIEKHGSRFTHATSIAPTGTIAFSVGNNVSSGVEPSYQYAYTRNKIVEGLNTKQSCRVEAYEYMLYKELISGDADPTLPLSHRDSLPPYFVTSNDLTPQQHIDVQAAAQKWIDSSISKTINVPTDISFEAFKDIYMYAIVKGLKGCTTYRFNPKHTAGVLVSDSDLKNTQYSFTLDDGTAVTLPGDARVEYKGQVQSAANLHDAIKTNMFGKF